MLGKRSFRFVGGFGVTAALLGAASLGLARASSTPAAVSTGQEVAAKRNAGSSVSPELNTKIENAIYEAYAREAAVPTEPGGGDIVQADESHLDY